MCLLFFFLSHSLHSEGKKLFEKVFSEGGDLSSAAVSCFTPGSPELSHQHTEGKSLCGFVHVCVLTASALHLMRRSREVRTPLKHLHFPPNETLPWRRPQCEGWRHGNRLLTAYNSRPTPKQGVVVLCVCVCVRVLVCKICQRKVESTSPLSLQW